MAALTTPLSFRPQRFFRWWLDELAGLLPERWRQGLSQGTPILAVDLAGDGLTFRYFHGARCDELGRVAFSERTAGAMRDAVGPLLHKARGRNALTALRLPIDAALRKTLEMPAVAESDLKDALFFQIDRQTPFAAEEVYFDYRVVGRDVAAKRLSAELMVVPRARVDEALTMVGRWGISPSIVAIVGDDPRTPPSSNLLPEGGNGARGRGWVFFNVAVTGLALALLAVAVYIPLEQKRARVEDLAAKVAEAQREAQETSALREEIEQLVEHNRFLADAKRQTPLITVILDELTRVLPDDSWVYQLDIRGPEIRVAGYSSTASNLIGLIDESPSFRTPAFRSPVTKDPRSGLERFNLSFQLESGEE
jgi:general secretion pathway protein L